MSRRQTWRPRRGRYLQPHETAALVEVDPTAEAMNRNLVAQGYALMPVTRPYLHAGRDAVTLRFVWRRRRDGGCVTLAARLNIRIERKETTCDAI